MELEGDLHSKQVLFTMMYECVHLMLTQYKQRPGTEDLQANGSIKRSEGEC